MWFTIAPFNLISVIAVNFDTYMWSIYYVCLTETMRLSIEKSPLVLYVLVERISSDPKASCISIVINLSTVVVLVTFYLNRGISLILY